MEVFCILQTLRTDRVNPKSLCLDHKTRMLLWAVKPFFGVNLVFFGMLWSRKYVFENKNTWFQRRLHWYFGFKNSTSTDYEGVHPPPWQWLTAPFGLRQGVDTRKNPEWYAAMSLSCCCKERQITHVFGCECNAAGSDSWTLYALHLTTPVQVSSWFTWFCSDLQVFRKGISIHEVDKSNSAKPGLLSWSHFWSSHVTMEGSDATPDVSCTRKNAYGTKWVGRNGETHGYVNISST